MIDCFCTQQPGKKKRCPSSPPFRPPDIQKFHGGMYHQSYPASKAFVSRLILLHVRFNKRLVTMSIPKLSEEEWTTSGGSSQIKADGSDAVTGGGGAAGGDEPAAREFTEEELSIHRAQTQACEVSRSTAQARSPTRAHGLITAITRDYLRSSVPACRWAGRCVELNCISAVEEPHIKSVYTHSETKIIQ